MDENYQYRGCELTPVVCEHLLIKLYSGKQFTRAQALNEIVNYHKEHGGVCNKKVYSSVFKKPRYH